FLGGNETALRGVRCGNDRMSDTVTERHIRNFDNFIAHGVNCIGVYAQGSNGGWPDAGAGKNGYTPEGALKPEFARRLEWLVREGGKTGVGGVGGPVFPPQGPEVKDEGATPAALGGKGRTPGAPPAPKRLSGPLRQEHNSPP